MKFVRFFTILLLVIFIAVSCTQDATDGLFAQVVTQSISASFTIKQYLGNSGEDFYYIEINGLNKNGTTLVRGNFEYGYMDPTSKDIYLLKHADSKIYKYTGSSQLTPISDVTFSMITNDGFSVAAKKIDGISTIVNIYSLSSGSLTPIISADDIKINGKYISEVFSSEQSLMVSVCNSSDRKKVKISDTEYYMFNGSSFDKISGDINGKQIGIFQKVDDGVFYTVVTRSDSGSIRNFYKISSNSATKVLASCNYLPKDGQLNPSFYDNTTEQLIFRSSSHYEIVKAPVGNPVHTSTQSLFSAGIYASDMQLVNVKKKDGAEKYIFAFYSHGVFEVDLVNNTIPVQISRNW